MEYDLIVVLGYELEKDWKLPVHVVPRLKKVVSLYKKGAAKKIVTCGKWSLNYDRQKTKPPITEARAISKELVKLGVSKKDIIREEHSIDTIGNAYFLKTKIGKIHPFKKILIACADFHLPRVKFIFEKVLGKGYEIDYLSTQTKRGKDKIFLKAQKRILKDQKIFLSKMQSGDESYLKSRLYSDPFFTNYTPVSTLKRR